MRFLKNILDLSHNVLKWDDRNIILREGMESRSSEGNGKK